MTGAGPCTGAIIAGGMASRMGGVPKGLERVGGERIIDRVAAALREACDDLLVVANDPAAPAWLHGLRVTRDVRTGAGALGGLHAALAAAAPGSVIVLAWDAPFVPGALLRALRTTGNSARADAALAASRSPWGFEPLCAWYGSACLASVERHLDAGDFRAGGWQDDVHAVRVDVSPWGDPDEIFFNVNSPADLAAANARAHSGRTA